MFGGMICVPESLKIKKEANKIELEGKKPNSKEEENKGEEDEEEEDEDEEETSGKKPGEDERPENEEGIELNLNMKETLMMS